MNDDIIRKNLAEAGSGATDWDRLRNMSEAEIDRLAARDQDALPLSNEEISSARKGVHTVDEVRYMIRQSEAGLYRWHIVDDKGRVLAIGTGAFVSREEAVRALELLRPKLSDAKLDAA